MVIDKELTVGQRFKKFRIEKGMSQNEVCEGICSYSVVSHLENDRSIPSAKIIGKLAERLAVPLREIMGETEKSMDVGFQIEVVRNYIEKQEYHHALKIINDLNQREDLLDHQRTDLFVCHAEALIKTKSYTDAVTLLLPFLEKQQIQQSVDDETLCDLYNKLGNAHYWSNDFEKAYSAFEQGYRISLKLPEFGLVSARVTKNLGLTCNQLGLKEDARRYLEKAYFFYEKTSDMKRVANTLFDLALATDNIEYANKARTLYEGMNMVREANIAKQYFAFHVEAKKDYKFALSLLDSATEEFENLGDIGMCVYTLSRSAIVCLNNDDMESAEFYIERAEKYSEKMVEENTYLSIDMYKSKAMYHLRKGNFKQCVVNSQKTSEMCDKIGLYAESATALQLTAEAYNQEGLFESAYHVLKRVVVLLQKNAKGE